MEIFTVKMGIREKRKGDTIARVVKNFLAIPTFLRRITEAILLSLSFIIGIGITSLILKGTGSAPLKKQTANSSWEPTTGSNRDTVMF